MAASPHSNPLAGRGSRAGMSLLELTISLALLSIVMLGVFHATERGLGVFRQSTANGEISVRAARALGRVLRELLAADGSTFNPPLTPPVVGPNLGNPGARYQSAIDFQAGAIVWGPQSEVRWQLEEGETANDVDDDGDGLVDEGSLVLLRNAGAADELAVVLANGVSELFEGELPNNLDDNGNGLVDEPGFCLDRDGNVLNVRLSLERMGPDGRLIVRSQEAAIAVRN